MLEAIQAFEQQLITQVLALVTAYGGLGILVGMFLESSILPIPSEIILVTAGLIGFSPVDIAIWGSIGSTLGAIVGYYIGLKGGRPFVDRFGKYFFVTPSLVDRAEKKFNKHGGWTILVSRLIPFIPYKVFSITSGILRFDLKTFIIFTFIGSVPRCFILGWVGSELIKYQAQFWVIILVLVAVAGIAYLVHRKLSKNDKN